MGAARTGIRTRDLFSTFATPLHHFVGWVEWEGVGEVVGGGGGGGSVSECERAALDCARGGSKKSMSGDR